MGSSIDFRARYLSANEDLMSELKELYRDSIWGESDLETIAEAFEDSNFRDLFIDYLKEVSDPEVKAKREEEIKALEKAHGFKVEFFHPKPSYVLACWTNEGANTRKIYVNICTDDTINKVDKRTGKSWGFPSYLDKQKTELDESGRECDVYTIMYHPDALKKAKNDKDFRKVLEKVTLEAIELNNHVKISRNNITYPQIKFMGTPGESVLRTKIPDLEFQVPEYKIRHRSEVSLLDFRSAPDSCMSTRPKELVIEIHLPFIDRASDVKLNIVQSQLHLQSCSSKSAYKLDVDLPYPVNDDKGKAEFNSDAKTLSIVLPIVSASSAPKNSNEINTYRTNVLSEATLRYPSFRFFQTFKYVVFVLEVKDVSESSVSGIIEPSHRGYDLVFSSGESRYSFCLRFDGHEIISDVIRVGSSNVILKLEKRDKDAELWKYCHSGINDLQLSKLNFVTDKHAKDRMNSVKIDNEAWWMHCNDAESQVFNKKELTDKDNKMPEPVEDQKAAKAIDEIPPSNSNQMWQEAKRAAKLRKSRSMSESATEDMKVRKRRGILKMPQSPLGRTMSESSDETSHSSFDSMSDLHKSQSSPDIPEEGYSTAEDGDKPKKHVRFMDKVSKNLYRSNSSILGQRKKNQRKMKNKKKNALKRSNSECGNSSCSEAEPTTDSPLPPTNDAESEMTLESNDDESSVDRIMERNKELIERSAKNDDGGNFSDNSSNDNGKWIQKKSKRSKKKNRNAKKIGENSDSGTELASPTNEDTEVFNPELYELD